MADTIDTTEIDSCQSSWRHAHAAWLRHKADGNRHWLEVVKPLQAQFDERWPKWPFVSEPDRAAADAWRRVSGLDEEAQKAEAYAEKEYAAFDAVLTLPAPDLAALRQKLLILLKVDQDGHTHPWSSDVVDPSLADIERLMQEAL